MYGISYSERSTGETVRLQALTAREAQEISDKLMGRGLAPTVEKDGLSYSYEEFKLAVESVKFGDG